jgi:hypothetical protein
VPFLIVVLITIVTSAQAGSITYSDLEGILKDPARQINSIDTLLAQPEFKPTYMRNLTTVYSSNSIQYADPLNPRIILFGEDAKLVLAFTCEPGDCDGQQNVMGSQELETMHWVEETKSFEFRDIHFPEKDSGDQITISAANPSKCVGCHGGSDPRPNWDIYPSWPGVYGGADDGLRDAPGESLDSLNKFLFSAKNRPRYKRLVELSEGYEKPGIEHNFIHNTHLTHYLNLLNLKRITDRMRKMPDYEKFKHAIALNIGTGFYFQYIFEDLGFKDLGKLAKDCAYRTNAEPKQYFEFPSETSRVVRILSTFGAPVSSWFMNFGATIDSELIDGDGIDHMFYMEMVDQDPTVYLDYDKLGSLAKEELKDLAQSETFKEKLKRCAASYY